ncbi:endonuclease/exonuclease/phosphatase family protein [Flavivirga spongiicola]|uniref:Endonuclease/exonuclease/phosphatase family protein n=1 Tax=Flavivirga spongiicola TaxID=421621 RepID=A0ABU7XNR7_9FLAO|nr:endonuclease/exonuclease/phosphatase family protein [Flavivirga sp. MEBiC05379]MDO5977408.1 LamG-like jellyroll fold domain-containing protein [Flavivirga sp. MEBiC05379]
MKKSLLIVILFVSAIAICQEPIININFDSGKIAYQEKSVESPPPHILAAQQYNFTKGLSGRALDLSENVALRMPLKLQEAMELEYKEKQSFSVQIWVKTLPDAQQGTPIIGNKKNSDKEHKGWLISSTENGGWIFSISDGKKHYIYKPSAARMPINDGEWHQIAITVNQDKDEVWMYYDGINVAIYNTPGLKDLSSEWITTIGGTASNWSYLGQMEAFNGYLDNIKIWDDVITSDTVSKAYQQYFSLEALNSNPVNQIKLMSWNIWGGGREFGTHVNLKRVIESIKNTHADVITLIETYGSGEKIADALGYHFYLISSNLSIMSRYPMKETIKGFDAFNFGGAILQLGEQQEIVIFDTWLDYLPDYSKNVRIGKMTAKELEKDETKSRLAEIKTILKDISTYTENANNTPIIMAGDFNTNSHLDWTEETKGSHLGYVIDWPVTKEMDKAGYIDSYRKVKPSPLKYPGYSYWPYSYEQKDERFVKDRIDFIFYKGNKLRTISSEVVDYHPVMFPSDHAFVVTTFGLK